MLTSRRPVRKRLRHGFAPDRKPPQNGFEVTADLGPQAIEVIEVEQTLNGIPQPRRLQLRIATSTAHLSVEVRDPGELLDDLAEGSRWIRDGSGPPPSWSAARTRLRHGFARARNHDSFEVTADLGPQAIEVIEVEQTLNGIPQPRQLQLRIATQATRLTVQVRHPAQLLDDLTEAVRWHHGSSDQPAPPAHTAPARPSAPQAQE